MSGENRPDSTPRQQVTVWPPPPDVPFVEPIVDPYREETRAALRSLNTAIFLFVGGSVLPFVIAVALSLTQQGQHWMSVLFGWVSGLPVLRYLWPVFYLFSAYSGIKSIRLAKRARKTGVQGQGLIISLLSIIFVFLSLHLLSL